MASNIPRTITAMTGYRSPVFSPEAGSAPQSGPQASSVFSNSLSRRSIDSTPHGMPERVSPQTLGLMPAQGYPVERVEPKPGKDWEGLEKEALEEFYPARGQLPSVMHIVVLSPAEEPSLLRSLAAIGREATSSRGVDTRLRQPATLFSNLNRPRASDLGEAPTFSNPENFMEDFISSPSSLRVISSSSSSSSSQNDSSAPSSAQAISSSRSIASGLHQAATGFPSRSIYDGASSEDLDSSDSDYWDFLDHF